MYVLNGVNTAPRINSIISPIKPLSTAASTGTAPVSSTAVLSVTPTNNAVAAYLQKFGLAYDPTDPFAGNYTTIANNNVPPSAPSDIRTTIESCLRARGILYYKKTPGDCALPSAPTSSSLKTGISITESSLGTVSALGTAGILSLGAAGTALSVATAGVGLAAVPILYIMQHHQAAVATEQSTICSVAEMVNQAIPATDYQVKTGAMSPNDGNTMMQYICQNAIQGLDSIKKTCNAACVYEACLRAHMDFAKVYYPGISPITQNHPVAPGTQSPQAPASFNQGLVRTPTMTVKPPFNPVATAVVPTAGVATPTVSATGSTNPVNVAPAAGTAGMPTTVPTGTVTFPVWELVIVAVAIIAAFFLLR